MRRRPPRVWGGQILRGAGLPPLSPPLSPPSPPSPAPTLRGARSDKITLTASQACRDPTTAVTGPSTPASEQGAQWDRAGGRAGLAPREVAALLTRTAPGAGSDRLPCDDVGCAGCGAATRRANGGLAGVVEAAARSGGTAVVDVRPQAQWATVRLAGSARVDLDDLDAAVAASTSCPAGRARAATTPLVVVCRRGRASRTALARLVAGGFARATELAGGLDAWRREMDPSFPDYG